MARIISHPFRLLGSDVATVDQASDAANAEQLAVLILTRRGERPLVPTFGIEDPAFSTIDPAELSLGVELHGPPVRIVELERRAIDTTTEEVTVVFE